MEAIAVNVFDGLVSQVMAMAGVKPVKKGQNRKRAVRPGIDIVTGVITAPQTTDQVAKRLGISKGLALRKLREAYELGRIDRRGKSRDTVWFLSQE